MAVPRLSIASSVLLATCTCAVLAACARSASVAVTEPILLAFPALPVRY